jgi:hypothetical protein
MKRTKRGEEDSSSFHLLSSAADLIGLSHRMGSAHSAESAESGSFKGLAPPNEKEEKESDSEDSHSQKPGKMIDKDRRMSHAEANRRLR